MSLSPDDAAARGDSRYEQDAIDVVHETREPTVRRVARKSPEDSGLIIYLKGVDARESVLACEREDISLPHENADESEEDLSEVRQVVERVQSRRVCPYAH